MPPAEMDSIPCHLEASSFKTFDKAMELPILHDAFSIASQLHEQATHFPTYNQVEAIVSNGIQLLDAELSEEVKTVVARAVLSLDSLISSGLDKLTTTVPSLAKPTDKIFPSLKLADYILAFFGLSLHQRDPPQESYNQATGVIEAAESTNREESISIDRCPGIETLSKEECILCSSSMLLCSNLPHLPIVSKKNKDEVLEVTKESQDKALDGTKDMEVTKQTQESKDDFEEVPVETNEYATKDTEETPKFFNENEESQMEKTEDIQVSPKDVMEVTEDIEVVDVIGAFQVVDVVETIEFVRVVDN